MKSFLPPFLSFTLALAWKDNTIICMSQAIAKGVIQPPNNCWMYHNAGDSVTLSQTSDFQCPSFSEQTLLHLYCIRLSNPGGPFPILWLTIPGYPGKLASRLYTKKGTQGKGNQNKNHLCGIQTLKFYWPSFQSCAKDPNGNYQEAFTIQY